MEAVAQRRTLALARECTCFLGSPLLGLGLDGAYLASILLGGAMPLGVLWL